MPRSGHLVRRRVTLLHAVALLQASGLVHLLPSPAGPSGPAALRFADPSKEADPVGDGAPGLPALLNIALHKPGSVAVSAVTDGQTEVFHEDQGSYALVRGPPSPWVIVDLQADRVVEAVEVWTPMRKCERRLRKLRASDKKEAQMALNAGRPPPLACRLQPQASVYFFRLRPSTARFVQVRMPGASHLAIAEVKVWGPKPEAAGGSPLPCRGRDALGEDCTTNPLAASVFLPTTIYHGWWDGELRASFQRNLEDYQEHGCDSPNAHPVLPGPGGAGAGLGSSLYFLAGQMTAAYDTRSPFLFYGYLNYAMSPWCSERNAWGLLSCYFRPLTHQPGELCPLSKCRAKEAAMRAAFPHVHPGDALKQHEAKHSLKSSKGNSADKSGSDCQVPDSKGLRGAGCGNMENMTDLPKDHPRAGLLLWRSLQIAYLLRPNRDLIAEMDLEGTMLSIGYQHPIIGLHMRGGDGCRYGVRARQFLCRSLADYVPQLRTMAIKYGTSRVFLATDEQAALQDTAGYPEFRWVFVPMDRSSLASSIKIEHRLHDESKTGLGAGKHAMFVGTLKELFLLGAADFYIGHLASTFSRLALNLNIVNHQRVPPFISMDGPWCPHWRMCCDVEKTGMSTVC